jgi:hypothetical protein
LVGTVALALAIAHSFAHAETAPWSVGISDAKKTEANRLLEQGNALFLEKKYAEALTKYRDAVTSWDHPAIRFNIVRCLIQLDRAVEAADNLKAALRYGADPLEESVYREALAYEKLLARQVGDLTIECTQRDVDVSLDGQKIATCPARESRRLAPGKHQVLGTGRGLLTSAHDVFVVGGETQHVDVTLSPVPRGEGIGARTYGKIAVIAGGGLLATAAGLGLYAWRSYRNQFPDHCMDVAGRDAPLCDTTGADALDRSRTFGQVATVVTVAGGVALLAGAIVIWRAPTNEHRVTPSVSPTTAGLSFSGSF